jgi:beta-lactam-binding protein with PASTA domain
VPSVFDISPLSDTVALDDQGNGETTFTVSNHPDRARRGRAQIKVEPGSGVQPGWFTIEEPEREFPVEGVKQVQQFSVKLKVPADKPLKGSFKLVVTSVRMPEVPDEHFTVGPPVGFEVKAVEPEPGKPFPWWIVVVGVVAVLLIGGLATWLMWPTALVVPEELVGRTRAEAEELLKDEGLVAGTITEKVSGEPQGTVITSVPPPGTEVEPGATVNLVLSGSPLIEVPRLIGLSVQEATSKLQAVGLQATVQRGGSGPPDAVTNQNPRPEVRIAPGNTVELIVPDLTVPELSGQTFQKAISLLLERGMKMGEVKAVDRSGAALPGGRGGRIGGAGLAAAIVTSQEPRAGTRGSPGLVVNVVVRMQ